MNKLIIYRNNIYKKIIKHKKTVELIKITKKAIITVIIINLLIINFKYRKLNKITILIWMKVLPLMSS